MATKKSILNIAELFRHSLKKYNKSQKQLV